MVISPLTATAALDVTASLASKTTTSAVLTIQNNVVATTGADGQYRDTLGISVSLLRASDRREISRISEFLSRGKETKNITFSSLASGTEYEAVFSIYNKTSGEKTSSTVSFTTSGQFTPPTTNIPLPVEFLKDKTVVEAKKIVLTVSNTSSENLFVEVFALTNTGSAVESPETNVPANGTALLTFSKAIQSEQTYDFRMMGKKPTDTNFNRYAPVEYKGVTTPKVTIVTGGQSGGSTTGQQTATVADVQTGKSLTGATSVGDGTCGDGKDNDGDGKRDWDGVASGGIPQYQPDPACLNPDMTEEADVVAKGSWIPCTNKCDLPSVFVFINSIIEKLITVILFPISVLMFVYAGYRYITAQGNPSKKADIKKMLRNLILGIIIILISWVAVQTALQVVGYTDSLYFF